MANLTQALVGATNYTVISSDTKNTAGSTDTSSKLFLIGATSQAANPQTYSHDTAYVGTDGCLYSGGNKVLTSAPVTSVNSKTGAVTLTASEVGAIATTAKGATNGVAELDANGLVPSSQLPSYVDDVLEYSAKSSFPTTGETGKIYVDTSTNLTYRWSGTAYVEISPSLALGTTSSTAYRGDYGNTAYTHATDANRLTTAKTEGLYKIATTAEGHIKSVTAVAKSDITRLGIPGSDTNDAVTQTATTTDANYEILFSNSANNTTETAGVRKDSGLIFNPNKDALTAGSRASGSTVGTNSSALGYNLTASGPTSHAEGGSTTASGAVSHAEGDGTTASGQGSHAEGGSTTASGNYSYAGGLGTVANHVCQHVFGMGNIPDPSTAETYSVGNYIEIVGNGTDPTNLSNARTLDWSGNEWLAGSLTLNNDKILIGDRYTGGNLNGTGLFINNYYDSDWEATYDLELEHRCIYQAEENSTSGFTNTNQIFPGIIQQELSLSGGTKVTSDIRPVSISLEAYSSSSSSSPDSKIFINSSDISLSGTNNSWDGTNGSLKDAISSLNSRMQIGGVDYKFALDSIINNVTVADGTTYNTYSGRKFSDYAVLIMIPGSANNNSRNCVICNAGRFCQSSGQMIATVLHDSGLSSKSSIAITYMSDTSYKVALDGAKVIKNLTVLGFMKKV